MRSPLNAGTSCARSSLPLPERSSRFICFICSESNVSTESANGRARPAPAGSSKNRGRSTLRNAWPAVPVMSNARPVSLRARLGFHPRDELELLADDVAGLVRELRVVELRLEVRDDALAAVATVPSDRRLAFDGEFGGQLEPGLRELAQRGEGGGAGMRLDATSPGVDAAVERRVRSRDLEPAAGERADARIGVRSRDATFMSKRAGRVRRGPRGSRIAAEARLGDHRCVAHQRKFVRRPTGLGKRRPRLHAPRDVFVCRTTRRGARWRFDGDARHSDLARFEHDGIERARGGSRGQQQPRQHDWTNHGHRGHRELIVAPDAGSVRVGRTTRRRASCSRWLAAMRHAVRLQPSRLAHSLLPLEPGLARWRAVARAAQPARRTSSPGTVTTSCRATRAFSIAWRTTPRGPSSVAQLESGRLEIESFVRDAVWRTARPTQRAGCEGLRPAQVDELFESLAQGRAGSPRGELRKRSDRAARKEHAAIHRQRRGLDRPLSRAQREIIATRLATFEGDACTEVSTRERHASNSARWSTNTGIGRNSRNGSRRSSRAPRIVGMRSIAAKSSPTARASCGCSRTSIRSLSSAQRAHTVGRLRGYARQLRTLAAEPGCLSAPTGPLLK